MPSLMQQSLSGIKWSALTQLVAQIAQYGSFILLARLLAPADFGIVAAATLVVGLVAMVNELGLAAALIQRQDLRPGHLNAAFWSNLAIGLLLWALLAALAGPTAAFFNAPASAPILAALALSFPLTGLAIVPKALLEKSLRFKALGLVDAVVAIVGACVALAGAWNGAGAWSLVFGTLAGYVVQLLALWPLAGWRPTTACETADLKDLLGFGLNVLGTRVLAYLGQNVDYLVIGHFLGPTPLGAYSLAYKLVTWPMIKISHVTLRVLYPAFARLQDDDVALRTHYARVVGTLALVVFPLLAGLAVLAPVALPFAFGPAWQAAVLPTQILCAAGALKATLCSIGTVFMSKGRPDLELMTNVWTTLLLAALVAIGVKFGIAGVAAGVLVATLVGGPWQQGVANKLIGWPMRDYWRALRPPALAALAAGAAVALFAHVAAGFPPLLLLVAATPVLLGSYLGTLTLQGQSWAQDLKSLRRGQPEAPPAPSPTVRLALARDHAGLPKLGS